MAKMTELCKLDLFSPLSLLRTGSVVTRPNHITCFGGNGFESGVFKAKTTK